MILFGQLTGFPARVGVARDGVKLTFPRSQQNETNYGFD